ncbi:MAG: sugar nucleotide-binding protein [Brevundimonas sp.]|nr:sugar nucleotide-binding protein [Brevundimonas sp.]
MGSSLSSRMSRSPTRPGWHARSFALSAAAGGPSAAVEGIPSSEYLTPAKRPSNSRLSTAKRTRDYRVTPRPWQAAVAEIVAELNGERLLP